MAAESLAGLAALLADGTRARFCLELMDGRAWTAGELAAVAGVAASTASEHLSRLVAAGLLVERRQGRHRYVRLAGQREAKLLEDLLSYLGPTPPPRRTLSSSRATEALARGRTCYDHLAGRLGVAITEAMTARALLTPDLTLTPEGRTWLTTTLDATLPTTRPPTRSCLDWTERRLHLAGPAAAHLCAHFQEHDWIRKVGTTRAVTVTPKGKKALHDLLALSLP
ncbi:helix-turn-helix domain-containing protein [Actinosynnema sp. NPDC020468]|uniref:ArsR/SmtB family transcription factor n=1 Tax=Actinosynnema sp. NPDC020468 TaxID=3154488 RepID=UPI0033EBDB5D